MILYDFCVLHAVSFFLFNDTATTEIYTLSLHDALPICSSDDAPHRVLRYRTPHSVRADRSEEHTSELQSPCNLVCRLLLEKKNIQLKLQCILLVIRRKKMYLQLSMLILFSLLFFFFFNDTATTEIYTLSLHDALPIWNNTRDRMPCQNGSGAN